MNDICTKLAEPFDPAIVSWRVGPTNQQKTKGMALAYIDARDVMRRLDEVCGPENWQDEYPWSDGKRVVCRIGIRIGEEWIWKTDGAGDTDTEGEKGALSDAFKRSAVKWGIGRYLYDVDSPWAEIEQKGKSYVIRESEFPKLRARLPRPGTPTDARSATPPSQAPAARTAPQAPVNGHLPVNPEEPPEVGEARRAHIKALIDTIDRNIKVAKNSVALDATWDAPDTKKWLAEIEGAGPTGKEAAYKLRSKYMIQGDLLRDAEALA